MIGRGKELALAAVATLTLTLSCSKTKEQSGASLRSRVGSYCLLSPGLRDDAARAQRGEPTLLAESSTTPPAALVVDQKFRFCIGIRAGDTGAANAKFTDLMMEFTGARFSPTGTGRRGDAILRDMAALMEELERRDLHD